MANDGDINLPIITTPSKANRGSVPKCTVMNTKVSSVSEYLNYQFNSFARFNGKDIAANQNGVFELDETGQDEAAYNIKAHVKTGIVGIYKGSITRLRDSFIVYRSDGDIRLTSGADKKATRRYLVSEQTDGINNNIKNRRIKFERGIRNKYFDFKIENINGSSLEIEKLTVHTEPIISKRR